MPSLLSYLIEDNIISLLDLNLLWIIFIYREIKDYLYLYKAKI